MRFGRVAPPVVSSLGLGADVVAGAKAATFGTRPAASLRDAERRARKARLEKLLAGVPSAQQYK